MKREGEGGRERKKRGGVKERGAEREKRGNRRMDRGWHKKRVHRSNPVLIEPLRL